MSVMVCGEYTCSKVPSLVVYMACSPGSSNTGAGAVVVASTTGVFTVLSSCSLNDIKSSVAVIGSECDTFELVYELVFWARATTSDEGIGMTYTVV